MRQDLNWTKTKEFLTLNTRVARDNLRPGELSQISNFNYTELGALSKAKGNAVSQYSPNTFVFDYLEGTLAASGSEQTIVLPDNAYDAVFVEAVLLSGAGGAAGSAKGNSSKANGWFPSNFTFSGDAEYVTPNQTTRVCPYPSEVLNGEVCLAGAGGSSGIKEFSNIPIPDGINPVVKVGRGGTGGIAVTGIGSAYLSITDPTVKVARDGNDGEQSYLKIGETTYATVYGGGGGKASTRARMLDATVPNYLMNLGGTAGENGVAGSESNVENAYKIKNRFDDQSMIYYWNCFTNIPFTSSFWYVGLTETPGELAGVYPGRGGDSPSSLYLNEIGSFGDYTPQPGESGTDGLFYYKIRFKVPI